ncbi:tyrosine-type recombinase/integrase [Lactiplantibacillus modestisalitolerans]|uniref:Tyrosine-type recombinase/integrase n=1 Tax=Lactiplantibacillus modestisalitolerans TaxID=1457219 RepID=A0ABV5WSK7_9LACO|nr:tyrosine-type recombinase/integrase [Lactiplantibacillus modestisalitolerans]
MATFKQYKTKAGIFWEVFASISDATDGRPKRMHKRGFKTKKEAQLWTSNAQVSYKNQGYVSNNDITFEQLYAKWFKEEYQQQVKESTWAKTADIFRLHITPLLGSQQVKNITVALCQTIVHNWLKQGLKQYRRFRTYVISVFDFGVRMELITRNPMAKTSIPKQKAQQQAPKIEFYEKSELVHFLECAYDYDNPQAFMLFRLLAFTGMRRGEALALQWNDINFDADEITINKTQSLGENWHIVTQTPKTNSSYRTIAVDTKTVQYLHKWRMTQARRCFELGYNAKAAKQLVFANQDNQPLAPSMPDHWNRSICKRYDLRRIKIHAFRHTFCTLSFEAGASVNEVSKTLGHADLKITQQIYLHVTKKQKNEAASKLARYMDI